MRTRAQSPNPAICQECPLHHTGCRLGYLAPETLPGPSAVVLLAAAPAPNERSHETALEGERFRTALASALERLTARYRLRLTPYLVWAVASPDAFDNAPRQEVAQRCYPYMRAQLARIAAETTAAAEADEYTPQLVLVPMGTTAMRALDIKSGGSQDKARGRSMVAQLDGHTWTVVPTLSARQLVYAPGTADAVAADLRRAAQIANTNFTPSRLSELTRDYRYPQTNEEVEALVDDILSFSGDGRPPEEWPIALDLETTGLREYAPDARLLMASVAWEEGQASAIPLYHEGTTCDPDFALSQVMRLWSSPKPKIFHHGKFDYRYGRAHRLTLRNWWLDTMYLKHAVNEDAHAFDLKSMTIETAPAYAGYEDQLRRQMAALQRQAPEPDFDMRDVYTPRSRDYVHAALEAVPRVLSPDNTPLEGAQDARERIEQLLATESPWPELPAPLWRTWRRRDAVLAARKLERRKRPPLGMPPAERRLEDLLREWGDFQVEGRVRDVELAQLEQQYALACVRVALRGADVAEQRARRDTLRAQCTSIYRSVFGIEPPPPGNSKSLPRSADGKSPFEAVPLPTLAAYAAIDADVTFQSARELLRTLGQTEGGASVQRVLRLQETLLTPAAQTLARMESRGIRIDRERCERYVAEITEFMEESLRQLCVLACVGDLNPNQAAEVVRAITEIFQVPPEELPRTDKGNVSISKEFLASLRKQHAGQPLGDFCHHLLRYRAAHKAIFTYLAGFLTLSEMDGRIHTQLHLHRTVTGRLASSEPNLQNVPMYLCAYKYVTADGTVLDAHPGWAIKELMLPDPGYVMVNLDIKQAEIRVLCAYLAQYNPQASLITAVNDGLDAPSYFTARIVPFAREIWGMMRGEDPSLAPEYDEAEWRQVYAYVEVNKDTSPRIKFLRTATKRVVYGSLYGAGPAKIAEQIYGSLPLDLVERQKCIDFATTVRDLLYEETPEIGRYVADTGERAVSEGYVESFFGRRRHFPYVRRGKRSKYNADAMREAVNFCIQSTASDLVLSQLIELEEHAEAEIGGAVVLTVHDSIVMQVPVDRVHQLDAFLRRWLAERIPVRFPWLPVAYAYDVEIGPTYGAMVSLATLLAGGPLNPKERQRLAQMGLPAEHWPSLEAANA